MECPSLAKVCTVPLRSRRKRVRLALFGDKRRYKRLLCRKDLVGQRNCLHAHKAVPYWCGNINSIHYAFGSPVVAINGTQPTVVPVLGGSKTSD